jgi:hypothetical protein
MVPISLSYTTPHVGTPRLCSRIDGPEVEHGAHFLILHNPSCGSTVPVSLSYTTPTHRSVSHREFS